MGTYLRIACPLITRLMWIGESTARKVAEQLLHSATVEREKSGAKYLLKAHQTTITLQESFTPEELKVAFFMAPCGLVVATPGDPSNVNKDLAHIVKTGIIPPASLSPGSTKGVMHIAAKIRRLVDWRHLMDILATAPDQVRTKLLIHHGHGNVSVLLADTPPSRNIYAEAARVTIRRILGAAALGNDQLGSCAACPLCDTRGGASESLEKHVVRYPDRGAKTYMHAGLIACLQGVFKDAGVSASATVIEARGLGGGEDRTSRPGDIVVLDYVAPDKHLLIDGVVTNVYKTTRLRETKLGPSRCTRLEDLKFNADKISEHSV